MPPCHESRLELLKLSARQVLLLQKYRGPDHRLELLAGECLGVPGVEHTLLVHLHELAIELHEGLALVHAERLLHLDVQADFISLWHKLSTHVAPFDSLSQVIASRLVAHAAVHSGPQSVAVSSVKLLDVALDLLGRHCIVFIRALLTEIVPFFQGEIKWVVVVVVVGAGTPQAGCWGLRVVRCVIFCIRVFITLRWCTPQLCCTSIGSKLTPERGFSCREVVLVQVGSCGGGSGHRPDRGFVLRGHDFFLSEVLYQVGGLLLPCWLLLVLHRGVRDLSPVKVELWVR